MGLGPGAAVVVQILGRKGSWTAALLQCSCGKFPIPPAGQGLGQPGDLEGKEVPALAQLGEAAAQVPLHHCAMGDVQYDQFGQPLRVFSRDPPGHGATPVMAGYIRLFAAGGIDQANYVRCQFVEVIGCDSLRLVAQVIATLVGSPDPVAGRGEVRYLVSPAVRELGKAVQ